MKKAIPWVDCHLPQFLAQENVILAATPVASHAPLEIGGGEDIGSYKEVWNHENCKSSMALNGVYEAGGNVCWFDPEILVSELPTEDPPLQWLREYAALAFRPETIRGSRRPRIRFPIAMEGYVYSADVPRDRYPSNLKPLAGHAVIYAWYYACWTALAAGDAHVVKMLYEAARTTTVCMRVTASLAEVAEASAKFSERVRHEGVVVDNFVSFTDKVMLMHGEKKPDLKTLVAKNLVFNNGPVNATMLRTILSLHSVFNEQHRVLLQQIDREYGRDVMSMSYNKLRLLLQGCKNDPDSIEWCLRTALASLRLREVTPDKFTMDTFSNAKDGTPSWMKIALAQRLIVQHMVTISTNIEAVNPQLSSQLLEHVITPLANQMWYASLFPAVSPTPASPTLEENGYKEAETQSPGSFSRNWRRSYRRGRVDGGGPCEDLRLHVRGRGLRIM